MGVKRRQFYLGQRNEFAGQALVFQLENARLVTLPGRARGMVSVAHRAVPQAPAAGTGGVSPGSARFIAGISVDGAVGLEHELAVHLPLADGVRGDARVFRAD